MLWTLYDHVDIFDPMPPTHHFGMEHFGKSYFGTRIFWHLAKQYESFGTGISAPVLLCRNVHLLKCPCAKIFLCQKFLVQKSPHVETSICRNISSTEWCTCRNIPEMKVLSKMTLDEMFRAKMVSRPQSLQSY